MISNGIQTTRMPIIKEESLHIRASRRRSFNGLTRSYTGELDHEVEDDSKVTKMEDDDKNLRMGSDNKMVELERGNRVIKIQSVQKH